MKKILVLSVLFLMSCGKTVTINHSGPQLPSGAQLPDNRQVNGSLVNNGNVSDKFRVSPNGTKIVYVADETTDTVDDLYVITAPSLTPRLNLTNLSLGKKVVQFMIAPNSQRIAFLADINTTGRYDLFTINMDGSNLNQVNLGLSNNTQIVDDNFKWTSDSTRIVFVSDEESTSTKNVYVSNFNGLNRMRLNSTLGVFKTFALASNDSRVVYRVNDANPTLRSVTLAGTGIGDVMLNGAYNTAVNPAAGVFDFKISSNSTKVLFSANIDDGFITDLYAANIDGTASAVKLNASMVSGGAVLVYDFASNDGSKAVYIADQDVDGVQELYETNTATALSSFKLNGPMVSGGDITSFKVSVETNKVVYLADQNIDEVFELYSVSLLGGSSTKINSSLAAGEQVADQYDLVGTQVVYASDKGNSGVYSLFSNNLLGTSEKQLTPTISTGLGFFDTSNPNSDQFLFTDNKVILLGSDQGSVREIFSVNMDGSSFQKLNDPGQGVLMTTYVLGSPAGSTIVPVAPFVLYRQNNGTQDNLILGRYK
jgi:hypothetical protein